MDYGGLGWMENSGGEKGSRGLEAGSKEMARNGWVRCKDF
jgi:hypothetical protein